MFFVGGREDKECVSACMTTDTTNTAQGAPAYEGVREALEKSTIREDILSDLNLNPAPTPTPAPTPILQPAPAPVPALATATEPSVVSEPLLQAPVMEASATGTQAAPVSRADPLPPSIAVASMVDAIKIHHAWGGGEEPGAQETGAAAGTKQIGGSGG